MGDEQKEPEFYFMKDGKKIPIIPTEVDDMFNEYDPSINKHLNGFRGISGDFASSIIRHEGNK